MVSRFVVCEGWGSFDSGDLWRLRRKRGVGWVKSLIMDGVPWVVSGSLAATAHGWPVGPGAGLTLVKSGVWCAFPRICRPVPGPGGGFWLEADMTL